MQAQVVREPVRDLAAEDDEPGEVLTCEQVRLVRSEVDVLDPRAVQRDTRGQDGAKGDRPGDLAVGRVGAHLVAGDLRAVLGGHARQRRTALAHRPGGWAPFAAVSADHSWARSDMTCSSWRSPSRTTLSRSVPSWTKPRVS